VCEHDRVDVSRRLRHAHCRPSVRHRSSLDPSTRVDRSASAASRDEGPLSLTFVPVFAGAFRGDS
jgi:hypothetical protein